jgi:hypothetical protein
MTSDLESPNEREIERVSASWLASQEAGDPPDSWVESWQDDRCMADEYMAMWRFVLKRCENVTADNDETIG